MESENSNSISIPISDSNSNIIVEDHLNPAVRLLQISKTETGSCGFDLSRSKWDPYPWVSQK